METYAVPEEESVDRLIESLESCLAELDRIEAHFSAAHVETALNALRRQFGKLRSSSVMD
jgi:hypothetical protein